MLKIIWYDWKPLRNFQCQLMSTPCGGVHLHCSDVSVCPYRVNIWCANMWHFRQAIQSSKLTYHDSSTSWRCPRPADRYWNPGALHAFQLISKSHANIMLSADFRPLILLAWNVASLGTSLLKLSFGLVVASWCNFLYIPLVAGRQMRFFTTRQIWTDT